MNITSAQLGELIAQLHQVNEELARAARPLERLEDLNDDQRQTIGANLRAGLARWENITQRIGEALDGSSNGGGETS
jgi:hypothetical protein